VPLDCDSFINYVLYFLVSAFGVWNNKTLPFNNEKMSINYRFAGRNENIIAFNNVRAQLMHAVEGMDRFSALVPPIENSIASFISQNEEKYKHVVEAITREVSDEKHQVCKWLHRAIMGMEVRGMEAFGDDDYIDDECYECQGKLQTTLPMTAIVWMFLGSVEMTNGVEEQLLQMQNNAEPLLTVIEALDGDQEDAPPLTAKKRKRLHDTLDTRSRNNHVLVFRLLNIIMKQNGARFAIPPPEQVKK
jgi:hypothetical protein